MKVSVTKQKGKGSRAQLSVDFRKGRREKKHGCVGGMGKKGGGVAERGAGGSCAWWPRSMGEDN